MVVQTSQTWVCPSYLSDQLYELYGLTCPPRWGMPRRLDWPTLGPAVARVMTALGTSPMPWQRYMLDLAGEVNPAVGVLGYGRVGLSVMRQMGKTALAFGVITHRALAWPRQRSIYSAQNGVAAEARWREEYLPLVEASPFAESMKGRKSRGSFGADWANGSVSNLASSGESSGHGPPLDLGFIDELFSQHDNRQEQAMSPAMLTRAMSQLWWASAGGTELSVPLNEKREAGREIVEEFWREFERNGWRREGILWPSTLYAEWSAPTNERGQLIAPRDDEATWLANMPAVCPAPPCQCDPDRVWHHTTTVAKIRGELEGFRKTPEEFDRAFLNITRKSTPPPDPNVPLAEWPGCVDVRSRRGPEVAFAADLTPRRDHAAIGVYSIRPDGVGHIEVIDERPGWEWVVAAFLRLRELWNPIAFGLDVKGPGAALLERLEDAGIARPADPDRPKRSELYIPTTAEVALACGDITDDVRTGKVRHIDQAPLTTAIEGTQSRPLGGDGGFAWARRNSTSNIAPWCAVTLARRTYHARADLVATSYDPLANIG